jgi:hypothetical protein
LNEMISVDAERSSMIRVKAVSRIICAAVCMGGTRRNSLGRSFLFQFARQRLVAQTSANPRNRAAGIRDDPRNLDGRGGLSGDPLRTSVVNSTARTIESGSGPKQRNPATVMLSSARRSHPSPRVGFLVAIIPHLPALSKEHSDGHNALK